MKNRRDYLVIALFISLLAMVFVRTAWVSDDGLIGLRTVDNFINGHGLRWNPDERVEVFTDPLWVLLLSAAAWVTTELYFTMLTLSVAAALAAVVVLGVVGAVDTLAAVVAVFLLTLLAAFVDYATSGLGTPVAYLLIAGFLIAFYRPPRLRTMAYPPRLRTMALMLGLLGLTAPMATLLLVPAFTRTARVSGRAATYAIVVAAAPIVAWLGFAYVYYGYALPNQFYAWWNQPHPTGPTIAVGAHYLLDSVKNDPLTLVAIFVALSSWRFSRDQEAPSIVLGLAVYLVAVVLAGGDAASGRPLAPAVFVSAFVIARFRWEEADVRAAALGFAAVVVLGYIGPHPTVLSGSTYGVVSAETGCSSVCDERWRVYQRTGLLKAVRAHPTPYDWPIEKEIERLRANGEYVMVTTDVGLIGYVAGARVHIVDPTGRTDPLLARLPAAEEWHPGFLARRLPEGYVDVLSGRATDLQEPAIASLERRLETLTRAPVFSAERLRLLVRPNRS